MKWYVPEKYGEFNSASNEAKFVANGSSKEKLWAPTFAPALKKWKTWILTCSKMTITHKPRVQYGPSNHSKVIFDHFPVNGTKILKIHDYQKIR
jgi:hypothetical protein